MLKICWLLLFKSAPRNSTCLWVHGDLMCAYLMYWTKRANKCAHHLTPLPSKDSLRKCKCPHARLPGSSTRCPISRHQGLPVCSSGSVFQFSIFLVPSLTSSPGLVVTVKHQARSAARQSHQDPHTPSLNEHIKRKHFLRSQQLHLSRANPHMCYRAWWYSWLLPFKAAQKLLLFSLERRWAPGCSSSGSPSLWEVSFPRTVHLPHTPCSIRVHIAHA